MANYKDVENDIKLTAWATDVFLKSTGEAAYKTDKFILGAHYANNNPSDYSIIRMNKLIYMYYKIKTSNKDFIDNGYVKFVQKHWHDNFDMACGMNDIVIELQPDEKNSTYNKKKG